MFKKKSHHYLKAHGHMIKCLDMTKRLNPKDIPTYSNIISKKIFKKKKTAKGNLVFTYHTLPSNQCKQ